MNISDALRDIGPLPVRQAVRPPPLWHRFRTTVRIGQVTSWQAAVLLIVVAVGWPWPVAGPALAGAAVLLALTGLRRRGRWLYEWVWCHLRFHARERHRHLPSEGTQRALLHLLTPDASVTSIRVDGDSVALVSRTRGATAVLRPGTDRDPVAVLPRPVALLPVGDDGPAAVAVQLVFHGVAGNRRTPWAWIAVQAVRTPDLAEESDIIAAVHGVVRRVRRRLDGDDIPVTGLDESTLLGTLASLAHVSDGRADIGERWHCWCCGSVAQAGFRLARWSVLDDAGVRPLLRRLLTVHIGAVVTVAVSARAVNGVAGQEVGILRVAAASADALELSVRRLRELAAEQHVRLDRMDGEHATAVAASLPLCVY